MGEPGDEQEWVRLSREGDHEAFAALVARHQRMIHSLAYRMTGSLAEAEDLAQETFLQAWRQLDTFRSEASFSTWLYRIAMNTCLNWRTRTLRREQLLQDWAGQEAEAHCHGGARHDTELSVAVQEALLKLDARQRAAVILTTYEGLNHAQAAQALGCSETTVSWRLFRARQKLKSWLQPLADGRQTP